MSHVWKNHVGFQGQLANEFRKDIMSSLLVELPKVLYMIHTTTPSPQNDIPKLLHILPMIKSELEVIGINFEDFEVTRLR